MLKRAASPADPHLRAHFAGGHFGLIALHCFACFCKRCRLDLEAASKVVEIGADASGKSLSQSLDLAGLRQRLSGLA